LENFALHVFHDQVVGADIVQPANVGMVQRGDGASFALGALRELVLGNLEGKVAVRVWRARFANSTFADHGEDFAGTQARFGAQQLSRDRFYNMELGLMELGLTPVPVNARNVAQPHSHAGVAQH